jgi:hypothetical protein
MRVKDKSNVLAGMGAQAPAPAAQARRRRATSTPDVPRAKAVSATAPVGASVEALCRLANASTEATTALAGRPLPEGIRALTDWYVSLGWAQARAEACLIGALDALDPRTGGGVAQPAQAYWELRRRAFALLSAIGEAYNRVEPVFARLVHGNSTWPAQPRAELPDRGDGRPLYTYGNTYKERRPLTPAERRAEHDERVQRFESRGGRWSDIITAAHGIFDRLAHNVRYDYVLLADGTLRLAANDDSIPASPGHSLLATGSPAFSEEPVLLAGELWVYRDSAGDTEALVIANNSGHYKPAFADLQNALPYLGRLGLDPSLVVLFGGPNNLPSMFEEMSERCRIANAAARLPPDGRELLATATPASCDLVSVRTWRSPSV